MEKIVFSREPGVLASEADPKEHGIELSLKGQP
jgi:hypothetical protein